MPDRHRHTPFGCHYTPLVCGFWMQAAHWAELHSDHLDGDAAQAIEAEFRAIAGGARSVTGALCLCDSPMPDSGAVHSKHAASGDGAQVGLAQLRLDIEQGFESVPLKWHSVHAIYVSQGRGRDWWHRVGLAARGLHRPNDLTPEPDGRSRRPDVYLWMALILGGAETTCPWPRKQREALVPSVLRLDVAA